MNYEELSETILLDYRTLKIALYGVPVAKRGKHTLRSCSTNLHVQNFRNVGGTPINRTSSNGKKLHK